VVVPATGGTSRVRCRDDIGGCRPAQPGGLADQTAGRLRSSRTGISPATKPPKEGPMTKCHEMKVGETYVCEDCGLELQVVKTCAEQETGACGCLEPLSCCGKPLALKK
jgi:hypothetical protein